ncbi:hypothetical protein TYRP_005799 [Tyrophagus putrescentiae]|nr:hypothetical protein TYRP_005799 [Tyrophagus putrescentiae]
MLPGVTEQFRGFDGLRAGVEVLHANVLRRLEVERAGELVAAARVQTVEGVVSPVHGNVGRLGRVKDDVDCPADAPPFFALAAADAANDRFIFAFNSLDLRISCFVGTSGASRDSWGVNWFMKRSCFLLGTRSCRRDIKWKFAGSRSILIICRWRATLRNGRPPPPRRQTNSVVAMECMAIKFGGMTAVGTGTRWAGGGDGKGKGEGEGEGSLRSVFSTSCAFSASSSTSSSSSSPFSLATS